MKTTHAVISEAFFT